jgi:protein gp37
MPTKIEWAEETWNTIVGCTKCSPGCDNCYAEKMATRLAKIKSTENKYGGVITRGKWNGTIISRRSENWKPYSWKKPRTIFVNSMGDTFHPEVKSWRIEEIIKIAEENSRHTFLLLTKRSKRMAEFFESRPAPKNVWCGVTVCNQDEADEKIPHLLNVRANIRFVSIEPMLGPVHIKCYALRGLHWVIVGGESGHRSRPVNPDWVKDVRDQCVDAGIPFLFKQWGDGILNCKNRTGNNSFLLDGTALHKAWWNPSEKKGGRVLDGVVHDEYPVKK